MKGVADMINVGPLVSFLLGAAMAGCVLFFFSSSPAGSQAPSFLPASIATSNNNWNVVVDRHAVLKSVLRNASTEDGTVIIAEINAAWSVPGSLLDLFLESFHAGEGTERLLRHVVFVSMDPAAHQRCRRVHRNCYLHRVAGRANYSGEQVFMTDDYLEMMWSRNRLQLTVLELGFNFLFTDLDVLWLRDPFRHISVASDIAISSDFYLGNPYNLDNLPNGGFLYAKSKNCTIEFYRRWHSARATYPGKHEQDVFNAVKRDLAVALPVTIQFLDTAIITGFCQLGRDLNKVSTVHANCCIGLAAKVHDLRSVLEDWKNYAAGSNGERHGGKFQWRVPGICIH